MLQLYSNLKKLSQSHLRACGIVSANHPIKVTASLYNVSISAVRPHLQVSPYFTITLTPRLPSPISLSLSIRPHHLRCSFSTTPTTTSTPLSSLFKLLKIFIKLILFALLISFILLYTLLFHYHPPYSTAFLFESKSYQEQLEKEVGFPFEALPKLFYLFFSLSCKFPTARSDIEEFVSSYSTLFLSHVLLGYLHFLNGDKLNAEAALQKAHEVARSDPSAKYFKNLIPTVSQLEADQFNTPVSEVSELVPGRLLAVHGTYAMPTGSKVLGTAAVVKNRDGGVVIINPTGFDENSIAAINRFGKVEALITTTSGHGDCLATASSCIWPDAKLYGTDPNMKHDHPELKWFFLPVKQHEQKGHPPPIDKLLLDFELLPFEGHIFKEIALYHRESRSLLGITDMILPVPSLEDPQVGFLPKLYSLCVGLQRGPYSKSVCGQNYHVMTTTNKKALKKSFEKIKEKEQNTDIVVLGHGRVMRGKDEVHELFEAFQWIDKDLPVTARMHLALSFIRQTKFIQIIRSMQELKQKRRLQQTK